MNGSARMIAWVSDVVSVSTPGSSSAPSSTTDACSPLIRGSFQPWSRPIADTTSSQSASAHVKLSIESASQPPNDTE